MSSENRVLNDESYAFLPNENFLREGVFEYIEHRLRPGHFLEAVMCNNLIEAVIRADDNNREQIPLLARWIWEFAPREAYGNQEKVRTWLEGK